LLLSEIEFLTIFGAEDRPVVYAGAAPGNHVGYLSTLFPDFEFHLYDPAPFSVKSTDKILIFQEFFTDEVAKKYSGKNALFISDVRSGDPELLTSDGFEERVGVDMENQKRWHDLMNPFCSMLKFRLPYKGGKTIYLDGDIYLPIWGPITTTESRLIVKNHSHETKEYDNKIYEEQLFYFNTVQRVALYEHDITGEGIDHCFDCMSELNVIRNYLIKFKLYDESNDKDNLNEKIARISREISRSISTEGRTLESPNSDPETRKKRDKITPMDRW